MCGIVGCVGEMFAKALLLGGLSRLEYRGYDSVGIAVMQAGGVVVRKTVRKVATLRTLVENMPDGHLGIGHTRWATHGGVSERNAHPHRWGRVTLVHNGILENHRTLRMQFEQMGHRPQSDTDTEIAAMLIDANYHGDPITAIQTAIKALQGTFAFAILFDDQPGKLYAVRVQSPLALMHVPGESLLASDVSALLQYGRRYYTPEDGFVCELSAEGVRCFNDDGTLRPMCEQIADWDAVSVDKGGYPHYMIKEIEEQPEVLRRTVARYLRDRKVDFSANDIDESLFEGIEAVHLIGCGTAMHAGLAARTAFEKWADVCADVEIASEFCDRGVRIDQRGLYVLISQSGETADTLAALRRIRNANVRHICVINARGSAMERESDAVLYTDAGPEISVASTKAFTAQVAVLYLIALKMAQQRGQGEGIAEEFSDVSALVSEVIAQKANIFAAAEHVEAQSAFYLGRGLDMALAQEGSLKLKEISYIHAEAYAAGEMKHGIISLIEPGIPTVMLDTQIENHDKAQLCAREVRARGGEVLMITSTGFQTEPDSADYLLTLPGSGGLMAAFPAAVCLQLLAYECARLRGLPIDQPRNLAKSVTVA